MKWILRRLDVAVNGAIHAIAFMLSVYFFFNLTGATVTVTTDSGLIVEIAKE